MSPSPALLSPRRRGLRFLFLHALLAGVVALFAWPAHAQTFPPFTGFVVDAANVIPPAQEAALTAQLDALQKDTGRQLVVATLPGLQGYSIEDYGYRLGRAWGVGLKGIDNGAILIVAPNERRVRIEVGYGLTPVMTDALSSIIISNRILSRFKANDMAGGITAGTQAIVEQLRLPDDQAKAKLAEAIAAHDRAKQGKGGFPISLVFWGIVLLFILLAMARNRGGGKAYRGRRGDGVGVLPVILWGPGLGGGGGWGGGGGGSSGGGGWGGGGFGGGGGGSFGGGGASGGW